MAAGELEGEPGVDRAEDGTRAPPRRFAAATRSSCPRSRGRSRARFARARGPRDRPREARRSAPPSGGPARRGRCGPARPVAGSHATTVSRWLVMPIPSRLAPSMPAPAIASAATRRGHLPDLGRVVLDPAGPAGSAARTPSRRGRRSVPRGRRRGTSCRSSPGRSRGSSAARLPSAPTTRERCPRAAARGGRSRGRSVPSRGARGRARTPGRRTRPARRRSSSPSPCRSRERRAPRLGATSPRIARWPEIGAPAR